MVAELRNFYGVDGVNRIPQMEGELLVRAALGDEVSVNDIPMQVSFSVRGLIFAALCRDLRYDEPTLDKVIVNAEKVAISEGVRADCLVPTEAATLGHVDSSISARPSGR
ncbi:hypothetical protein WEI85_42075 [Actinomycetes bacterium KLBMP 9797]